MGIFFSTANIGWCVSHFFHATPPEPLNDDGEWEASFWDDDGEWEASFWNDAEITTQSILLCEMDLEGCIDEYCEQGLEECLALVGENAQFCKTNYFEDGEDNLETHLSRCMKTHLREVNRCWDDADSCIACYDDHEECVSKVDGVNETKKTDDEGGDSARSEDTCEEKYNNCWLSYQAMLPDICQASLVDYNDCFDRFNESISSLCSIDFDNCAKLRNMEDTCGSWRDLHDLRNDEEAYYRALDEYTECLGEFDDKDEPNVFDGLASFFSELSEISREKNSTDSTEAELDAFMTKDWRGLVEYLYGKSQFALARAAQILPTFRSGEPLIGVSAVFPIQEEALKDALPRLQIINDKELIMSDSKLMVLVRYLILHIIEKNHSINIRGSFYDGGIYVRSFVTGVPYVRPVMHIEVKPSMLPFYITEHLDWSSEIFDI